MVSTASAQITAVLARLNSGERQAADDLLPLVYAELRKLARVRMARENPGLTLQPTGLVHEAYLRLVGEEDPSWANRAHFFAASAEAMRRILIDRARRYARVKHGGGERRVTFDDQFPARVSAAGDLLALDQALQHLEQQDGQMAEVVKLRYFAGLDVQETARMLDVSPRTVNRLWTAARAWLLRELGGADTGAER